MVTFNLKYFLLTLLLFVTEVLIAVYVHDSIIRPYGGDFLVVMLMYCAVKTFIKIRPVKAAVLVLLFAYLLELLQYFKIADRLGLPDHHWAKIVIGNGFAWLDLVAYTLGVIVILVVEKIGKPDEFNGYD